MGGGGGVGSWKSVPSCDICGPHSGVAEGKGVLGYNAGVLANKAVIFRVTQSEKSDLDCLILQTKALTTLREIRDYLKVSNLITSHTAYHSGRPRTVTLPNYPYP